PARVRAVGLAEPLEDVRQELRLDADAGIADRDLDPVSGAPQPRFDAPAFARELDGVREQVPDGLLQTASVADHHAALAFNRRAQGHPFHCGAGPDDVDGGLKDAFDLDRLGVEFEPAGDDARGVEDVIDQSCLRLRALRNYFSRVTRLVWRERAAGEHARPTHDRVEWRGALVRNRGQKFILHPARRLGLPSGRLLLPQEPFAFLFDFLALGNIHDDRIDAEDASVIVLDRIVADEEMNCHTRMGGCRRAQLNIQNRLASPDHAPENRLNIIGYLRQDLARRTPQMLRHGFAVDLRQTLVDADVSLFGVHEA